ncbi:MAG: response regulator [Nanoarchaeota archaeon]|nr:response regulator [Nanoarchaeota archaeon]
MKENKLEILVVEDTPENLAVAKEFYNSQDNLVVDYATNREDALSLIDSKKYDGVITDRTIPNTEKDISQGLNLTNSYMTQGSDVLVYSIMKKIPSVMYSQHGQHSQFILFEKDPDKEILKKAHELIEEATPFLEDREKLSEILTHGKDIFRIVSQIKSIPEYEEKQAEVIDYVVEGATKKDPKSWSLALNYLKKEISKRE